MNTQLSTLSEIKTSGMTDKLRILRDIIVNGTLTSVKPYSDGSGVEVRGIDGKKNSWFLSVSIEEWMYIYAN